MKKMIDCRTAYLPFLCKALDYSPGPFANCIVCVREDGRPVAGVIYDGYNGATIMAHIWVDAESTPSREWYAAIFDYPFNRLKVHKIVGQVRSTNEEAMKLDHHFGFELEAVISKFYDTGADLLVYTMTREQCRILNSPAWAKTVDLVSRV